MNYQQHKYNTSRHSLETSFHYHVKHKSLKSAFTLTILSPPSLIFLNTWRNILLYLLVTYCLVQQRVCQLRFYKVENCWTFGTAFNRVQLIVQLMDSAPSRLERAKGGHFELWQYGKRVRSHSNSESMFQNGRICFFSNRLTIHELMIKVWHSFVIKNL